MLTMTPPDMYQIKSDLMARFHTMYDPQVQHISPVFDNLLDSIAQVLYDEQFKVYNELMNMHTHTNQAPSSLIDEEEAENLPVGNTDPRKTENDPLPSTKKPLTDEEKKELENERDVEPEANRLQEFFFPNSKRDNVFGACECGIDASGSSGKHSSWCPKGKR